MVFTEKGHLCYWLKVWARKLVTFFNIKTECRKTIVSAKLTACIYFLLTEQLTTRGSYQEKNKRRKWRPGVGRKAREGSLKVGIVRKPLKKASFPTSLMLSDVP